jgi:hypothetical protein
MTRLTMLIALSVVFGAAGAAPARADVVDATDAGFSITITSSMKATPTAVFQAITGRSPHGGARATRFPATRAT